MLSSLLGLISHGKLTIMPGTAKHVDSCLEGLLSSRRKTTVYSYITYGNQIDHDTRPRSLKAATAK